MREINLYCDEHGYLGSSRWLATLEFIWCQHLLSMGGEHIKAWEWGRDLTPEDQREQDLREVKNSLQ